MMSVTQVAYAVTTSQKRLSAEPQEQPARVPTGHQLPHSRRPMLSMVPTQSKLALVPIKRTWYPSNSPHYTSDENYGQDAPGRISEPSGELACPVILYTEPSSPKVQAQSHACAYRKPPTHFPPSQPRWCPFTPLHIRTPRASSKSSNSTCMILCVLLAQ
ncbi:Uncharacterized protein HZ326_30563 [Fusarium oxysporum f. sp. albedinis]|nr:Uncharacterized protein HZ326_30563 [Fusarium oxysporum f. sp. albedinis]